MIPPLVVSESSANETGTIFVSFSKPIFTPEKYKDLEKKKAKEGFDDQLSSLISLSVSSSYFDEGSPELEITDYSLQTFD